MRARFGLAVGRRQVLSWSLFEVPGVSVDFELLSYCAAPITELDPGTGFGDVLISV